MAPQDKILHQNQFQIVGYGIVDTFTKFDAIFICRSKVITRAVSPLAVTLIGTIMPQFFLGKFCMIAMNVH